MPVKIRGVEELTKALTDLEINIPHAFAEAGRYAMQLNIEGTAKQRSNVDTGYGRASIHTAVVSQQEGDIRVETGTSLPYMVYQEFGTGIYAIGPGGSQAKKIPWHYYYVGHKGLGNGWRTTRGNRPTLAISTSYEMNQNRLSDSIAYKLGLMIENAANQRRMAGLASVRGDL